MKKLLAKIFSRKSEEDIFYENMFIKNKYWNTAHPNSEEKLRWEIINKFISKISNNNKLEILDLGSGRGWLSNKLAYFGHVQGIEPIAKVVKYANKLFPEIDFKVGKSSDIRKVYNEKKFDLIVSSEVIEHIPTDDKKSFVTDIYDALQSKGYAIITTPRKEEQELWMKYTNPSQPVEEWMTEDEVENLFREKNFTVVEKDRFSISPNNSDVNIEIYQLWLFQKI